MASATHLSHSSSSNEPATTPLIGPSQAQFSLGTTLLLFLWPSLTLAVSSQWGGPSSSDKREWLAQTTIDVLQENPDADAEWIEAFLLQVMLDEFEVSVEDESAWEVAEAVVRLRGECRRGVFVGVQELWRRWEARGKGREGEELGRLFEGKVVERHGGEDGEEEEEEESGSQDEDEDEDGDGDVEMDEAPSLVRIREPVVPEVDEDGFTKVTKKKR